jgi:hypothetical protein
MNVSPLMGAALNVIAIDLIGDQRRPLDSRNS